MEFTPDIDEKAINDYLKDAKNATPEQARAAMLEAGRQLQSNPVYKEKLVQITSDAKGKKVSDKLATGINLVLAGTDIANSINQVRQGDTAAKRSRRPSRPVIPQRDALLQQALSQSQQGTFDQERAIAPVRAEIQDQYQNDIANAKIASTGQAGAFGAYAQLAANNRNRAALNLAPIQDQIKAREQQRYDSLLGMRMDETQQMFGNQAQLYNQDLNQYNQDQQAAASLGSVGRENLRGSLYNLGSQIAPAICRASADRRIRNLRNQLTAMYGDELGNKMTEAHKTLDNQTNNPYFNQYQSYSQRF
jgi:hypothetical protein